jgi:DNA-binding transcriptional ArsR family regulator
MILIQVSTIYKYYFALSKVYLFIQSKLYKHFELTIFMGYILIAPVGENSKALFVGMKEFPTERVILLATKEYFKEAKKISQKLEDFTIKTEIRELDGNVLEIIFEEFADVCSIYDNDNIIVNVATGNHSTTCASLSAAYANGLKAFDVMGDMVVILPIMKLSYYHELSDNKMDILKELSDKEFEPINKISEKLKMSISLLSYHINGNDKYKGLKSHRLIDTKLVNKNLHIKLSAMGKLLLKGYIQKKR